MVSYQQKPVQITLWKRFLQWLDGSEPAPTPPTCPKPSSETEILLSTAQRKKLEEAVNVPEAQRWETSFYRRETSFTSRSASEKPITEKDSLII